MEKNVQTIKKNICQNNLSKLSLEEIKVKLGYDDNYDLFNGLLSIIKEDIECIDNYSVKQDFKYLNLIMDILNRFEIETVFEKNDSVNEKLRDIYKKIKVITEEYCISNSLTDFLNKFDSSIRKMSKRINRRIDEKEHTAVNVRIEPKEFEKSLIDYILFEMKDIYKLDEILRCDKRINDTLCNNIEYVYNKIIDNYLSNLLTNNDIETNKFYIMFLVLAKDKYNFIDASKLCINKFAAALDVIDKMPIDDFTKKKYGIKINKLISISDSKCQSNKKKYNVNFQQNKNMKKELLNLKIKGHNNSYDLREEKAFTIDTAATNCYDDALSISILPNGNYQICVFIADLTKVVLPHSNIEKYAFSVGKTFYGRDGVIDMLPPLISLDKCSLNRSGNKYVHAYIYEITPKFEIVDFKPCNAIIQVRNRYSYKEFNNLLKNGKNTEKNIGYHDISDFAKFLIDNNPARMEYLKSKEKIDTYKKGLDLYQNDTANIVVSELKVLTNTMLAQMIYDKGIPFIYRNNVKSNNELPEGLKKFLSYRKDYSNIKSAVCSDYSKSFYSSTNEGHYGIGVSAYSHSTTPLRCAAALVNQRIIQKGLIEEKANDKYIYYLESFIPSLVESLNNRIALNYLYSMEEISNPDAKKMTLTKNK